MDKKITTWCIGVLITLFAFPAEYSYSLEKKPMLDNVFYYLNIDTANVHVGYLRMDSAGVNLAVDNVKGDYAMWYIKEVIGVGNRYVLVNKMSLDTLKFAPPFAIEDTIATKNNNGRLRYWDEMLFNEGVSTIFFTSYVDEVSLATFNFLLTMNKEGVVNLSTETSSMHYNRLNFVPERVTVLPDENKFYRLVVDTLDFPDISDVFTTWKVLAADTMTRPDSLVIADTISGGDFALWKFNVDTVLRDTTFLEIRNKVTDSILAFAIPANGSDTIAYIDTTGTIRNWCLPFFIEEGNKGKLMVRDTASRKDYYLAWHDSSVILTSNKADANCLKFVLVEDGYKKMPFDSTSVYSVKYITGVNAGKYLASNDRGDTLFVNKVYPHIPDGQFVVNKQNNYHLSNRLGNVTTAQNGVTGDSVKIVYDEDRIPIRNMFSNGIDTIEIAPITSGNIEHLKHIPGLGYKSFTAEELAGYTYAFSSSSVDTLMGKIMGYNIADSTVIILSGTDTARFKLQYHYTVPAGAQAIGQIPQIERKAYSLRSVEDTTLFVAKRGNNIVVETTLNNRAMFYIKEDTIANRYFFIDYVNGVLPQSKLLINSTKKLNLAAIDSVETHSFIIVSQLNKAPDEPDDFIYLKVFPDSDKGKGLYDLRIIDPLTEEEKWLTKNFDNYAVVGKEGESMLRAGSFTPSDLHLWLDTARGTGFNPIKPSFYIVNSVDTTTAGPDKFNIEGYFLHVMDSTSLTDHEDYVFDDGVDEFNRANFVKAKRYSTNELLLQAEGAAQLRDSVGFAGKNTKAINEYRFFIQESGVAGKYYIVTEAGYGDGGKTNVRGYLSLSRGSSKIYFGPRDSENVAMVTFSSNTVSNEIVKPPVIEEVDRNIYIIGGTGQVTIRNAMGQDVVVYNILGQPIAKKALLSDNESVPASRGIAIVKLGTSTRKVVVK